MRPRRPAHGVRARRHGGDRSVCRLRNTGPLGSAQLYNRAPGLILRCPSCDAVLVRLVAAPGRTWLDVRGLAYLQFATEEDPG